MLGVPPHQYPHIPAGVYVLQDRRETGEYVHEVITAEPYVHMEPIDTHHIGEDITAEPYLHIDDEPLQIHHSGELIPKTVSHSNAKFSTKLYDLLREKNYNFVFSPFSISVVMAMLSAGAREETLKQIEKGFFFPPSHTLQAQYKNIIPAIRSTDDFTIEIANKVFVEKNFSILRDFQEILRKSFHSDIMIMDFGDSEAAADTINNWVEDRTRNKIKDLIQPDMINEDTSLVLVNAIYFKSNWAKKFDRTEPMKFHVGPSSNIDPFFSIPIVEVPMMRKTDNVFYASLDTLNSTMIELPYKGDRIVMQVLLPNTKNIYGLEELEDKLKDVDIHELFEKEKVKTEVIIGLPKFKQEITIKLKKELSKLGLKNMFSRLADFSGITGGRGLHVSHVVQKAFIEVNEEGTEAAAATGAVAVGYSGGGYKPWFIADHPFIFYLRDKETGILLFQGRVIIPCERRLC